MNRLSPGNLPNGSYSRRILDDPSSSDKRHLYTPTRSPMMFGPPMDPVEQGLSRLEREEGQVSDEG
jgi:hypothetical protein